jgi:hypothetical protein
LDALAELVHAGNEIVECQHDAFDSRHGGIVVQHGGDPFIRSDQGAVHGGHAVA